MQRFHARPDRAERSEAQLFEEQIFEEQRSELVPGAGDGRGTYTCRRLQCFERAAARQGFNRTLRKNLRIDPDLSRLYTG